MPRPASAWRRRRSACRCALFVVDLSSVGRDRDGLIVMVNPPFVARDGMQLEEEGCLSVPGFNATVVRPARTVLKGLDRHGQRADDRGHDTARPRVPARDGSPRRHGLRRSPARHQARPDRPEDPEDEARRQMVTTPTAAHRLLRHAGVRGADAAAAAGASRHARLGRMVVALVSQPDRPKGRGHHLAPTANEGARARRTASRCCSRSGLQDDGFLRADRRV